MAASNARPRCEPAAATVFARTLAEAAVVDRFLAAAATITRNGAERRARDENGGDNAVLTLVRIFEHSLQGKRQATAACLHHNMCATVHAGTKQPENMVALAWEVNTQDNKVGSHAFYAVTDCTQRAQQHTTHDAHTDSSPSSRSRPCCVDTMACIPIPCSLPPPKHHPHQKHT